MADEAEFAGGFADFDLVTVFNWDDDLAVNCEADFVVVKAAFRVNCDGDLAVAGNYDWADCQV